VRILLITDAWHPQINGVVRTLETISHHLQNLGHEIRVVGPNEFRSFSCPTYPEISLAFGVKRKLHQIISGGHYHSIHIATEGPLGFSARRLCLQLRVPFTTAYHSKFPEFIHARAGIPTSWVYRVLRRFHAPSQAVMVATNSLKKDLACRGFKNLKIWSRGVDTKLFRPRSKDFLSDPRPISLYVGRVAVEKNIGAFLDLELPGTKYVVGDGPQLAELKARFSQVKFVGLKKGEELAQYFSAADVFVFPSKSDTFGLVLLEALASGLPVAAYPVTGPVDILQQDRVGVMNKDLGAAVTRALKLRSEDCRNYTLQYSWENAAKQFLNNLSSIHAEFQRQDLFGEIQTRSAYKFLTQV